MIAKYRTLPNTERDCMMNINSNLRNIGLAALFGCVLFPLLTVKADSEVSVDPTAPVAEIFKAAENAISRLEKRQADDLVQFLRSETRKAQAWQEIADLDEQLLNFILLRQSHGVEALELKWRQYSAGCREKRILLLLLSWNYLLEHWDDAAYLENSVRYWDLSAWNPTSGEYQARREEIDFVRKHGRNAYDRIERLIAAGKRSERWKSILILVGCILWWLGCTILHPFLRRKEGEYNFPTRASIAIRWLGILIPIAVLLAALLFEIRNFR